MFWAKARRIYKNVNRDDPDIRLFSNLANEFQKDVYRGLPGIIQDMGHKWVAKRTLKSNGKILEIGFGSGRHNLFFSGDRDNYFVSEYSSVHQGSAHWQHVKGRSIRCDARKIPFADNTFETVISIYNLEHIQDLNAVLNDVCRVLKPGGKFLVVLPCEDGFAWNLGRELTTRRHFQKKYGINYDKVIAYEHVWSFDEIVSKFKNSNKFNLASQRFYPFLVPSVNLNIVGCLEFVKPFNT